MKPRKNELQIPSIPAETEYLITDVEELVNNNVGNYLADQPFRIKVTDYMPEMREVRGIPRLPIGITRLERNIIQDVVPGQREFVGMDLLFSFPLKKSNAEENPVNVELKWSDGTHLVLARVDGHSVLLVSQGEKNEQVIYAAEPSDEDMYAYLETVGLPNSFWDDDFKDLMGDIYSARDIKIERHSNHLLDLGTTLEVSHDARYMTNDEGDKELVQELCLNIDHVSAPRSVALSPAIFRNMFRFERNEKADQWKYRGAYAGKLESGDFIDQMVQRDPKLGVPGSKLLEKAFVFLSEDASKR